MTEADWLACPDPQAMLEFLRDKASDRKLRLFAVACSRRIWSWIDVLGQNAVNVAERFADGLADPAELRVARLACREAGENASWYAALSNSGIAARNAARSAEAGCDNSLPGLSRAKELLAQANLVRDIFGNLFHPVTLDFCWLTANVASLAQAIYDDRDFKRMPALGNTLEEAGCANADVLAHCRESGEHVRGCWVVDMILGKE
jgi:hypothetical protein